MNMGGANFDLIMQEVMKQKQQMEQLEAENRELRMQLANLREGKGIVIEICGTAFLLSGEKIAGSLPVQSAPAPSPVAPVISQPAISMPAIPETPHPDLGHVPTFAQSAEVFSSSLNPAFLEEILEDQLTNAVTSPMAAWPKPATEASSGVIDERQKASLRRDLVGSFLLE